MSSDEVNPFKPARIAVPRGTPYNILPEDDEIRHRARKQVPPVFGGSNQITPEEREQNARCQLRDELATLARKYAGRLPNVARHIDDLGDLIVGGNWK